MKTMQVIIDRDSAGLLRVDPAAILQMARDVGPLCIWRGELLEASGDISSIWPKGMLDLENRAATHVGGVELTWAELFRLADVVEQTTNCRLLGQRRPDRADVISIEAFDSGEWRVSTTIQAIGERVRRRFSHVTEVKPE